MEILTETMVSTLQTMASTQGVASSTLARQVDRVTISQVGDSIKLVNLPHSILEVISSILGVKQVEGEDGQHSKVVEGPILDKVMLLHLTWEGPSYPWTPW